MVANLKFSAEQASCDPSDSAVIVVGQVRNLLKVKFDHIKCKLAPRVTEQVWTSALESLNPSPTDTVNLYLNCAFLCALPRKCSRHNAPSRAHAITKLVKSCSTGQSENIVLVCERSDMYASGCAVARAYPLFTRKTSAAVTSDSSTADGKINGNTSKRRNNASADAFNVNVEFILTDESGSGEGNQQVSVEELQAISDAAYGIQLAAKIVDTPCSEMHTDGFLELVDEVGQALGIKPHVIRGEELRERGFGGIYGVGKAAVNPPALAVLSHKPRGATETIAWVGKGIVFDTGGLSIKGKTAMPGMKRDCGGAAGILGAFYAAVRQGFSQNLHAILCLAENAVGDRSTRPDDIHELYSGRTVEINNTDAEGRLVVSDGVVYANKDLHANVIVDMCTLTGAQGVSTGRYHAAHLTNNENWENFCAVAGRNSGDLSFPLVYCPELHFTEFSSAVADMKNSVADRSNAQSSCAGLFINAHLGFDYPGVWLHIDMAYPVHSGERATGFGVALLNTLFGKYSKSRILNELCPVVESADVDMEDSQSSKSKKMRKK